ncbi:CaiB/BaiF CoA transferase family protein [uncultured Mycobacterium sp.]|uniref:CaiB/BaiF CoA transferase family protein n=1 Tax=uncultured Mycobacterium sp. TaxID=171292 RepID=UPI0035CBE6D3
MHRPLDGVRVLEVAQFTFVPAAGAVLADWGADVIKIENPVTGDPQRGLVNVLGRATTVPGSAFAPIIEAPNRGKRSIALGLAVAEARPVLEELIRRSDVFLTSYLPTARAKLHIDVDDVRRINPDIIYVAGSGFGSEGPDRDTGAYDSTAFWARGGSADGVTCSDAEHVAFMPAGAYGDNIAALALAGGMSDALRPILALLAGGSLPKIDRHTQAPGNPLTGNYRTSDGYVIQLSMLQPARYWPEFCRLMGCDEFAHDSRFESVEALAEHADAAYAIVREAIGSRTFDQCAQLLRRTTGQWAPVQDPWDVGNDEALIANGRIVDVVDAEGKPRKLVANPVKFDDPPLALTRAPQFAEHTDDVLREIGVDDQRLTELKFAGAIT